MPVGTAGCGASEVAFAFEGRCSGVGTDFGFGVGMVRFVAIWFKFKSVTDGLTWGESFNEAGNLLAEETGDDFDVVMVAKDAVIARNFVVSFA